MNNAVNIAFHDSLIVYNYPIESHIYVLNRLTGSFRALEADSRYTKNCAEKCLSKDYSLWERHQIENPHFFDVMYLSEVGIYARLHLGGWHTGRIQTWVSCPTHVLYMCLFMILIFINWENRCYRNAVTVTIQDGVA